MDEYIPLTLGDVHWVFLSLTNPAQVRERLIGIAGEMETLARRFGVRAGRAGSGLEYVRLGDGLAFPGVSDVLPGVFGVVTVEDVSFRAGLFFERHCAWSLGWGPPWEVQASVEVTCGRGPECGLHFVAEKESEHHDPEEAVEALSRAITWLTERAAANPIGSWRARIDPCEPAQNR